MRYISHIKILFADGLIDREEIRKEIDQRLQLDEEYQMMPLIISDLKELYFINDCLKMFVADQTIGCDECQKAWWGEDYTDDPTLFHSISCSLWGRRDIAAHWFNLDYIEKELGRRVGIGNNER